VKRRAVSTDSQFHFSIQQVDNYSIMRQLTCRSLSCYVPVGYLHIYPPSSGRKERDDDLLIIIFSLSSQRRYLSKHPAPGQHSKKEMSELERSHVVIARSAGARRTRLTPTVATFDLERTTLEATVLRYLRRLRVRECTAPVEIAYGYR
jgi:hypothetical protein